MAKLNVNQTDRLTNVEDALDRALSAMQTVMLVHGTEDRYIQSVAMEIETAIDELEAHKMDGLRKMFARLEKPKTRRDRAIAAHPLTAALRADIQFRDAQTGEIHGGPL